MTAPESPRADHQQHRAEDRLRARLDLLIEDVRASSPLCRGDVLGALGQARRWMLPRTLEVFGPTQQGPGLGVEDFAEVTR